MDAYGGRSGGYVCWTHVYGDFLEATCVVDTYEGCLWLVLIMEM